MEKQQATNRQEMLLRLYRSVFPVAARYMAARGAGLEDAQDIFQDALVAWYEQKYHTKTACPVTDEAYLMGIVKNLWRKKAGKNSPDRLDESHDQLADMQEEKPSDVRLMNYLSKAGRKCMELLQGFYYERLPLTELAGRFGFSGIRSATVQKYKCLEKVRETIKQKSLRYEDFLE